MHYQSLMRVHTAQVERSSVRVPLGFWIAVESERFHMNSNKPIRVLTADDHHIFREGIASVINVQPDMRVVSQASSGPEAIRQYGEHRPDVMLMDLRMPDLGGMDALIAI